MAMHARTQRHTTLRMWTVVCLSAFATACGSRACGSTPSTGTTSTVSSAGHSGSNGPGLRPRQSDLKLPVPRTLDLSHVQPEHFAAALGKDPARIFQFVRDEIGFETYIGCLRGPRGTLMAMAGNSVDRASLLSTLLTESGQRVRFAHGTLPEPLAKALVTSMWAERPWTTAASHGQVESTDLQDAVNRLTASIQVNGVLVRDALKKAGYPQTGQPQVTVDALVKAAQDHYWVQWMQNGAWTDLDTSFDGAVPGQTFAQSAETFDVLPEALFHRIDIRVRLEEYTGDAPSGREALRYSAKAADLSGLDVVFAHEPEGNPTHNQFKPFLVVGRQRIAGVPFHLKAPGGDGAMAAVDAFGGGPDPVALAMAESIEMEFTAPGAGTETVVRDIFDRVGKSRRIKAQRLTAEEVTSSSEAINSAEFSQALYDLLFTTGSIDAGHLRDLSSPAPPGDDDPIDVRAGLRWINVAFSATSDAALRRLVGASGATYRLYLDTPRVQIADMTVNAEVLRFSLDLRRDRVNIATTGTRPDQVFHAHVLQGVVNGALERIVIEHVAGSPRQDDGRSAAGISTSAIFESVLAAKTPTVLVTRGSATLGSEVPEDTRARIDEAVAQGHVVVAPQRPVIIGGVSHFAWWQIEPRSGATIAVTDEGLHQATVDAVVTRRDGEVHMEFSINGSQMPYQARNFANGPQARLFINGLFEQLAARNIIFTVTRWTSLL